MSKGLKFLIGFFMMFTALNTSSSMSAEDLYDLSFNSIDGSQIYLSDFNELLDVPKKNFVNIF